ncbi:enoyl-CoA hydratase [Jatrophihabitans sp. GAS493]|uniref:crotonase/enoyl-CoA hydratase family protein n=1 Tax=Jatrophihabitans sp. GAS493 TaxID=1907575 RepID=UPI000BB873DB|nr:crotonase/enoyl-CoA hydratase family protein [Jatrophihabitans sp. GAS493]SOD72091.1 enoyl-CoA hydratase [Jatrophihabitans sp. GAS493]
MGDVLVEHRDGIAIITINRPESRNAVNRAVSDAATAAIDELDARSDLVVGIITGAGGFFSAGMDLKAFLAGEKVADETRGMLGFTQTPTQKPLIAAVEGPALAGGCEIALACDLIVAAEDSIFGIPEVKRGLVAAGGGLLRLPRRIPQAVAMELALTGDPISAADALRIGLINSVTPAGGALDGALALAKRITANGPLAVAASREIVRRASDWSMDEGWEESKRIYAPIFSSADASEGALAFAEKRRPSWQGR